ncbi:hypothetical protein Tco_0949043 [Tanacetum coccineum]
MVTEEESSESEAESWGNDDDDNNNDQDSGSEESDQDKAIQHDEEEDEEEIVKTPSNDSDDEDETKIADKAEDIPTTEAGIVSPLDIPIHHEVPSQQTPTLLTVPVSVISDSSHVFSTVIPQSLKSFTPLPHLSTPTPPPTTKAINPSSTLPDFALVFQFNNRVIALEQEVVELKKDPLQTQVTTLVDEHLDAKLGATRDEFMNFLSASLTARITKQVKD